MVKDKMCIGVVKDEMMSRINPTLDEVVIENMGCRRMDFTGNPMKGYVFISLEGMKAKASKKKPKKNKLIRERTLYFLNRQ